MTAISETLFPMPFASESPKLTLPERVRLFCNLSSDRGGLFPPSAVPDMLGVSHQRVSELCQETKLEVIMFFGQRFISGRSLTLFRAEDKSAKGPGRKVTRWQLVCIAAKTGTAIGEATYPSN